MIHIAICEDKEEDMAQVRQILCRIKILCDVTEYTSAEALMLDIETNQKLFDIFLLDIFLSGQSGMEAAGCIRKTNQNAIIIFLSASEDFYREAFDLYAFHYLIKPVAAGELAEVLQRAAGQISRPEEMLQITFRGQKALLRHVDIRYISSSNHTLHFHMQDGQEYTSYGKLDELDARLAGKVFVRCHKSFIANLLYVNRLAREGFYIGDTLIPISRSYAAGAKKSYQRRLFGIFQDN